MKLLALVVVGATSYELEWREFQVAQGARNGDIPQAFKDTVNLVAKHNSEESTYKLSYLGPFADKTLEEYKQVLGYKPKSLHGNLPRLGTHVHSGADAADEVDWTSQGVVSGVKNQGQCGSCWAFSTTGSTESAWAIATGKLIQLSEQQLVDCVTNNLGCEGGNIDTAFEFYKSQIIATEESYPYSGIARDCSTGGWETAIPKGGVTGYKDVKDENVLLDAVSTVGPVSVAIEADQQSFQLYSSGVLTGDCGTNLDHGVLVVGYGTMGGVDYWKVKNSWGVGWGVDGFLYIQRGVNKCGIADMSSYPTVDPTAPPTPQPSPAIGGTIKSRSSQKCLDIPNGNVDNGQWLGTWECSEWDQQKWAWYDGRLAYDGGTVWSKCVDVPGNDLTNGNYLELWDCNGQPQQQWGYDGDMGTIYLASSGDASKCLDLQNGGRDDGTPVQLWDCVGGSNQEWDVYLQSLDAVV